MNTGRLWLTAGILVVVALLFMSCGPQVAPPPTTTPAPAAPAPAAPGPAPTPAPTPVPSLVEKPMYGGTINVLQRTITENFDGGVTPNALAPFQFGLIYEHLIFPDWSVGMAGSGKHDFGGGLNRLEYFTGHLAEKYEIPGIGKWIFQIRKGVRFALNPTSEASRLVNGREFTADDVVFSINYLNKSPSSAVRLNRPTTATTTQVEKAGPWEVTVKIPLDPLGGWHWTVQGGGNQFYFPQEVIAKYGNLNEWRNIVGTGPFMMTDFVSGSVATFSKNPNYWGKNPVGPGKGDQLPYMDTMKYLVVPDFSTRLASIRTGKADWVADVPLEDAQSLMRTKPDLKSKKYLPTSTLGFYVRTDKENLPFRDKRVRQALMMATDFESLKRDLYSNEAEILIWPVSPLYKQAYVPIDQLPEPARQLYKYNPEKAKHLLAEAGYPQGLKTRAIVQNVSTSMDPAAAIKAMWSKVGVDLELQPRETAVFNSINSLRSHEEMMLKAVGNSFPIYLGFYSLRGTQFENGSYINDPAVETAYQEVMKNVFVNMPKAEQLFRAMLPHLLEQAYVIPLPSPYSYRLWQPWVKNYNGEAALIMLLKHAWIDQDLKEKMTGRR